MKAIFVLSIIAISSVTALTNVETLQKWKSYQEQFGKSYRSPLEARKRLTIFKENLKKIDENNALYEQGKSTHTEGINQFTDWTEEEFLQYVNKGLIDEPVISGIVYNETGNMDSVGSTIDWRIVGVVSPVKNQGQCGSCWSFSATGSIEGQLAMQGRKISLSEQNLIDCSSSYGNKGCDGGSSRRAFDYVMDSGIESEEDYPYRASNGICRAEASRVITRICKIYKIESGNEESLRHAIATEGPISVSIDSTAHLQRYSGGILRDNTCSSQSTNHGVLAVGYGSVEGIHYYILKNSWGKAWGEDGYFRLEMRNNQCGIAKKPIFPELCH